jgi:hypothetical protein
LDTLVLMIFSVMSKRFIRASSMKVKKMRRNLMRFGA